MPPPVIETLAPVAGLAVTLSEDALSVTIDRPDSDVDNVVARLLAGPAVAYAKTKDSINATTLTELDRALERELRGQSALLRSHDFTEGARAFQRRRTPTFTDR